MDAITFAGSVIRHLILAGDQPRESHEDATVRLMIQRERRRGIEDREIRAQESRLILPGRA